MHAVVKTNTVFGAPAALHANAPVVRIASAHALINERSLNVLGHFSRAFSHKPFLVSVRSFGLACMIWQIQVKHCLYEALLVST